MSITTRFRILTSLGIGIGFALGGAIIGYLVVQAARLFGWEPILGVFVIASLAAFVIDVVTTPVEPRA